jgi:outer membrane immunogenic protein
VRPRLGYVFNDNRSMAFVTAGLATARIKRTYYFVGTGQSSSTDYQTGWTAGVGGEHFVTDMVSLQLEARYTDYGTEYVHAPIYGAGSREKQTYDDFAIRISALYHF